MKKRNLTLSILATSLMLAGTSFAADTAKKDTMMKKNSMGSDMKKEHAMDDKMKKDEMMEKKDAIMTKKDKMMGDKK